MRALDVSFSSVSEDWARARKAEGWEALIQCAWTGGFAGNAGIRNVCGANLAAARRAGLAADIYVNATPPDWWPIEREVAEIRLNCGAAWNDIERVYIDVEIAGTTVERATALADAMRALGKRSDCIYTARWWAVGSGGGMTDPRWRARFPFLWNAHYDNDPDVDFARASYGLWTLEDLAGEQYQNTTDLAGVSVDLNNFRESYYAAPGAPDEEDPLFTETDSQRLETLYQISNDPVPHPFIGVIPGVPADATVPRWVAMFLVYQVMFDKVATPSGVEIPRFMRVMQLLEDAADDGVEVDVDATVAAISDGVADELSKRLED